MHLQIAFAADTSYVPHLGAALVSLFENNQIFSRITVHLLSNDIAVSDLDKLNSLVKLHGREMIIYDLNSSLQILQKTYSIPSTISISSYARLFLSEFVGEEVTKIIYADCDSVFLGSLRDLWNTPFEGRLILGVKDHVGTAPRTAIRLSAKDLYINAGFLFIDLRKWRAIKADQIMINFIAAHNGKVNHHDQGVINGCFHHFIGALHPRYNVMTSFFDFKSVAHIRKFYQVENFYSQAEINEAVTDPVFVHYTPSFSKRPWIEGSKHPLQNQYWEYVAKTPWAERKRQKDDRSYLVKTLEKLYWILGATLWKKIFV